MVVNILNEMHVVLPWRQLRYSTFQVPVIDGLETAMLILLKSRAQKLSQRRQLDIRDQSEEFTGMLQRAALSANFDSGTKTQREDITKQRRAAEREARR